MLSTLLSTAATLLLIRYLSPADWGSSAAILGLGQLIGALVSYGSQIERVRRYSGLDGDERSAEAALDARARWTLSFSLLTVGLVTLLFSIPAGATVICAAGVYSSLGATNYFVAARRFWLAGSIVLLEKTFLFGTVAASVLFQFASVTTLPIVQGLVGLLAGLISLLSIQTTPPAMSLRDHARRVVRQYGSARYVGIASLAPSLLLLDVSLVHVFSTPENAAQFSLASKLVAPLSLATTSIVTVLLPFMVGEHSERVLLKRGVAVFFVGGFLLVLAVLLASANWWVPTFFGKDYSGAVFPVRLYLVNTFLAFFTRILVTRGQARNDDRVTSLMIACQVLLALVGIAIGAQLGGASGAAVSVVSTNLVLALALSVRGRSISGRRGR
ncbi:lipopolysaccharide biosynthesis protein [Frigoribacterium faeni]|uniref:lipopolysaccharide biosynthesis protein n=1 Tax=Frigoribacterium faeni TaxID=145483 RepID=UPI002413249B|nr:hypothetical protein [Frigoribacterium faeni]